MEHEIENEKSLGNSKVLLIPFPFQVMLQSVGVRITTVWICLGVVLSLLWHRTVPMLLLLMCRNNNLVEEVHASDFLH